MGKTKNNSSHKSSKWAALITYVIALVCLLLGFLVPFGNAEVITDNMLAMQLLDAVSKALTFNGNALLPIPELGAKLSESYSITVNYFGMFKYNIGALLVVLYAIVTVAALIGLIPVIASNKKSATALKTASFIECLAIVPLLALVLTQVHTGSIAYALLIALGGTLVMLIVQAIVYKKGSGLIKFILFLLSAIATLFCVFNIAKYIPGLKDLELLGGLTNGLYGGEKEVRGAAGIAALLTGDFANILGNGGVELMILNIAALAASILILINLLLDIFGLGKKTKKFMLISNLVRYSLEVLAVLLTFIMTFFAKDVTKLGLLMIALLVIAIVQLVINIIRLVTFGTHKKKAKKPAKKDELTEGEPAEGEEGEKKLSKKEQKRLAKEEIKAAKEKEAEEKKAAKEQAAEEKKEEKKAAKEQKNAPAVEEHPGYLVYNGPTDSFINKLTNAEKTEFFNVFLERNVVSLPNIPQYVPGGKNEKFFSAVFIYFGKIRDYVSDGLLNKLYEQINMM